MATDRHGFLVWVPGDTQPDVEFNDLLLKLESRLNCAVLANGQNDAAGGEANGSMYIVGASPTGAFAGFSQNQVAIKQAGTWYAITPIKGWQALDLATGQMLVFNNSSVWAVTLTDLSPYVLETDIDTVAELNAIVTDGPLATEAYVNNAVSDLSNGRKYKGVNNQTGTSYTAVLADAGWLVTMSNVSPNSFQIPAQSSVNYDIGTQIDVLRLGAGLTSITIDTDTLIGNSDVANQNEIVSLIKIASATWVVVGGV